MRSKAQAPRWSARMRLPAAAEGQHWARVMSLSLAGLTMLVLSRMPGTAIGWLLGLVGLLVAAEMLTEQYTIYGLITAPGSLPAARPIGWFAEVVTFLTVFLLLLLVLLFRTGDCRRPGGGRYERQSSSPWPARSRARCRPERSSAA